MSHQARGHPVPNYQDGEYTATAGGETIVPIQSPGASGTTNRLRRSASVEHNFDNVLEKPPSGSSRPSQQPPAFVREDNFFNENITLPRLAVNEREHITAEDYDNEDRGSLDNEEQSYDRTVKYSQSRSGSLPPRGFHERSSYTEWSNTAPRSQYFESHDHAREGGGQLISVPWNDYEQQHQLQQRAEADQQQQYSKQTVHQTHEKSHNEQHDFHRNYYGGHRRRGEHYSHEGGRANYGGEEWHERDMMSPYYRPEHTSTLRGANSSKHQRQAQQQYAAGGASSYSHHNHHRSGGSGGHRYGHSQSYGYHYGSGGADGGYYKERKYRRINCCCFPCIWPPWGFEETHPPRPMYYSKPPPPL